MSPAKRRKIESLVAGAQAEPDPEEGMAMEDPEKDASMPAMAGMPSAPMEQEKEEAMEGLIASQQMLGGAKVGDTVSFKVKSIDPKTGEGSLEAIGGDMET
jgi:hypothetical protein